MRRLVSATLLAAVLATPVLAWSGEPASSGSQMAQAARGVEVTATHVRSGFPRGTAFVCSAVAEGQVAIRTSVTRCSIRFTDGTTVNAPAVSLPGRLAITGGFSRHPLASFTFCATATATFLGGVTTVDDECAFIPFSG